jgi:hypothetical protein
MAEVVLKITGDNTSAENALNETANTLSQVSTTAKKTSSDIKKGLDDVAASAKKANDEIANPKPSENQKKILSATQQLKKEIKELEAAALAAGEGTEKWAENIALAGQKKADLKDLKEAIAALDPDAVAKTFLGLASSVAGAFTVTQSAIALTGARSEELEKTLLKVQAAQGLLSGLQQLANTKDELGKAKIIILNKLNVLELSKINAQIKAQILLTGAESIEVATLTAAKNTQAAANAKLTISQRILNLVMNSNPIGILIAALAALAAVVVTYISQTESAKKAEEERSRAIDGTIIKTKELRDAYNEYIIALEEVKTQQLVLSGALTETEGKLRDLSERNRIALQEIKNETKGKLAEAGGFWDDLGTSITSALTGYTEEQVTYFKNIETIREESDKLNANQLKTAAERLKIQAEADKKAAEDRKRKQKEASDEFLKAEKDFQDALKSLREKARAAEIQSLSGSERIEAERKLNQEGIDALEKSLIQKGKLIDRSFELSEEQQKQFGIIRNQIDKEANDKLLAQNKAFYEKSKKDQEEANQAALDFANQQVDANQKALSEANKAKVLLTKEGSKERLDSEVQALESERDFILQNTTLTNDQRVILEQETLQKIADLQKDFADKQPSSLAKLLGITDAELEKVKAGLNKAGEQLKTFFTSQISEQTKLLDEQLKLNDEAADSRDKNIDDLQRQLEEELKLQKDGLANNVDAIKSQIADEQAAKQSALENEKRIKEEKKKLALAQLAIDSATQVSDLVTSSTEIFKAFSAIPFVGVPLAIATISLMLGAFISAKAKAVQAINQGFKEGGYTGDYGVDEVAGSVHGQEFVSTAKTTKKHRKLLEAMHTDNYSHLTFQDLSPLLSGTGVTFNREVLNEISVDQAKYNQQKTEGPERLLKAMESTNKNINKFFQHYKNKPEDKILPDGTKVIKKGDKIRIIRKK